jgi:ubiquitin-like-conjugating enzyme ATG3
MDSLKDNQEKVVEEETGDGGWVDTHYFDENSKQAGGHSASSSSHDEANKAHEIIDDDELNKDKHLLKRLSELSMKNRKSNQNNEVENGEADDDDDDDGEAVDMDEYDHNIKDDDDETTIKPNVNAKAKIESDKINPLTDVNNKGTTTNTAGAITAQGGKGEANDEEIFIPTRSYDLHITYDNYYRTPRLWLSGYDENHKPLTIEQMYDDISEDHAKKTVTFETHPHIPGTLMASIHPCRHAEVMKKLINLVAESGKELEVYNYLMIFLKFVQSVIPTIEYDYTRNITI